jgi:predicted Zn-ribbon and HTH transcriptional regulator
MVKTPHPSEPEARGVTIRSALRAALLEGPLTARELSARVGIGEKEVAEHLEHLARSLRHSGERFLVEPARCLACGFVFKERTRLARPSKCPVCRSQRLKAARFHVAGKARP